MHAVRSTPFVACHEDGERSTLSMVVAGDAVTSKEGVSSYEVRPGTIHLCPRRGGTVVTGYNSFVLYEIEHKRLQRVITAMGGEEKQWNPERSYVFAVRQSSAQEKMWSFLSFADQLLGESSYVSAALGLDDHFYRLLGLALLQEEGAVEKIQKRQELATRNWTTPLDDLVDYIRLNPHLNITLTDLEEQSLYSGRHLQNLFKEKFDCTPMQFVRKRKLSVAIEKLQAADFGDTVTGIARECGYLYTSNFTVDFQREFGVNPSAVLKRSRQRGRRADRSCEASLSCHRTWQTSSGDMSN